MERAAYLKELVDAYQAWRTLAHLESTTRERLIPLLQRHGLDTTPDPERRRVGEQRGRDRAAAGFAATVKSMTESLQPFLTLYARLQAEGPAEDRRELEFLNAHEVALHEFATRAVAGGGRDSLAPIRALLARGKA